MNFLATRPTSRTQGNTLPTLQASVLELIFRGRNIMIQVQAQNEILMYIPYHEVGCVDSHKILSQLNCTQFKRHETSRSINNEKIANSITTQVHMT